MFIHVSQHIQQKILGKAAGVNAELVVSQIVPLPVCEELVVGFSGFIHFFYQGAGALFFTSKALHYIFDTLFIGGVNKKTQTVFSQNIVCTTSYKDTVLFCCKVFDNLRLCFKEHVIHRVKMILGLHLHLFTDGQPPLVCFLFIYL